MNYANPTDPPIAWLGGKRKLRKVIVSLIPADHRTYIEVFGGAAWVLFAKPESPVEVYNDINSELVNFFRVVKYCPNSLIDYTFDLLDSREWFKTFTTTSTLNQNEIERAAQFYYLNRTSFGANGQQYGVSKSGLSTLHRPDRITEATLRLHSVKIENLDWRDLIQRYDFDKAFFYLDPPYDVKTSKDYVEMCSKDDYREMADRLKAIKGRFLVSLNDSEFIRETFSAFEISSVGIRYSINDKPKSKEKVRSELLISNYEIEKIAIEKYQKRYQRGV